MSNDEQSSVEKKRTRKATKQSIEEDHQDEILDEKVLDEDMEELEDNLDLKGNLLPRNSLKRLRLEKDKNIGLMKQAEEVYKCLYELEIADLDILRMYSPKDLSARISEKMKGVGDTKAQKLIKAAEELSGLKSFVPLSDVQFESKYIWSGSLELDNLLGGGFRLGESYELYGGFGGGKTQICASVACRSQLDESKGGLRRRGEPNPEVLWFDSEDTLISMMVDKEIKERVKNSAKKKEISEEQYISDITIKRQKSRLAQICDNIGLDFKTDVLPNIRYVPVVSLTQQVREIQDAVSLASEHNWKLIILDSISKTIRAERTAEDPYAMKYSRAINNMLGNLHRIQQKCGAAIICTNQVWNKTSMHPSNRFDEVSYGGGAVTHNLNVRLHVYHGKGTGMRLAELMDAAHLEGADDPIGFVINNAGIGDI